MLQQPTGVPLSLYFATIMHSLLPLGSMRCKVIVVFVLTIQPQKVQKYQLSSPVLQCDQNTMPDSNEL